MFVDALIIGIATALGAAVVGVFVAAVRHGRQLARWAHVVGRKVGIPFPLEGDEED
jgi:hypothetical protein